MVKELKKKLKDKEFQFLIKKGYIKPTLERDISVFECFQEISKRFTTSYAVCETAMKHHISADHVYAIIRRLK